MMVKYKSPRPTRKHLAGLSPSEFKTLLRRRGYIVARDLFKYNTIASKGGRLYRFRWWSDVPVVDVSCPVADFDRWANSVEHHMSFEEWLTSV